MTLAAALLTIPVPDASGQEHLVPELGSFIDPGLDWTTSIREALLKNAAFTPHRARVVTTGFGKPAWVVSLISKGCGDCEGCMGFGGANGDACEKPTYFVDYAGFDPGDKGLSIRDAKIRKAKAPVDGGAAEAIQRVWLRMLREVRHPRNHGIGADGVTYHFSRFVGSGNDSPLAPNGIETGQIWSPDPASLTGRLASLGEAMKELALAFPDGREKLGKRILKEAMALQSDLDKRHGPDE